MTMAVKDRRRWHVILAIIVPIVIGYASGGLGGER
jgi:hypothetical protein